jgi:TrmH family RNA methyltransferase
MTVGAGRRSGDAQRRATDLVKLFEAARHDSDLVVLEGFHALKHALRFGAEVSVVATCDAGTLARLIADHAPQLGPAVTERTQEIPRDQFRRLGPYEPHTGVVSIARRARYQPDAILGSPGPAPVVLLEDPRHRGNFGAVVRVAAAAQAAGVLSTGAQDPWNPVVVRGAAGLQFAVPVACVGSPPESHDRALVALDPDGAEFDPHALPDRAILAFGSERAGLSAELRARADMTLRLPMRHGVSSLNLATAVAAVLYSARLSSRRQPGP